MTAWWTRLITVVPASQIPLAGAIFRKGQGIIPAVLARQAQASRFKLSVTGCPARLHLH